MATWRMDPCRQLRGPVIGAEAGRVGADEMPTTLNAEARDRAEAICNQFVVAHFDADARDLGYEFVGILDRDGGNLAACSVD